MQGEPAPWEYWRVQFAEKGICSWAEFEDMDVQDIQAVIAVWDGIGKAEATQARKSGAKGGV